MGTDQNRCGCCLNGLNSAYFSWIQTHKIDSVLHASAKVLKCVHILEIFIDVSLIYLPFSSCCVCAEYQTQDLHNSDSSSGSSLGSSPSIQKTMILIFIPCFFVVFQDPFKVICFLITFSFFLLILISQLLSLK